MHGAHVVAAVVLGLAIVACGDADDSEGEVAGAPETDESGGATTDGDTSAAEEPSGEGGPEQIEGTCALGCDTEADCVASAGGDARDWTCTQLGTVGVCEFVGATPPPCDPSACSDQTAALCNQHLGQQACIPLCEGDDDCTSPMVCGGTHQDGSTYCVGTPSVSCSAGQCTCFEDADCPVPGSICGPNEG